MHHAYGQLSDGIIYLDDKGDLVKLDKNGRPYLVGEDGVIRGVGRGSSRPVGVSPEVWNYLRPVLQREGKTYEQYMQERDRATKKEKETDMPAPDEGHDQEVAAVSLLDESETKQL